jgi:PAS domain S-box-containing protein
MAEPRQSPSRTTPADILESLADPVVAFDKQWRYTYVSRRAAQVLGKDAREMIGKTLWELFPDDVDTGFQEACARAWAAGQPVTVERYSAVLDQWVENYIYPFADGASTQWRDISARKRAEESLRHSESLLRTLGDNLPEAVLFRYCHDPAGNARFDFVSAGIEGLTGIPATDFMTSAATLESSILPEDHEYLRAAIVASREGLTPFEVEVRRRNRVTGEIGWSLLRSTPTRTPDGSTIWDGIEIDVTRRRRAEDALRESERSYHRLFESLQDSFIVGEIICDASGKPVDWRYLDVNPAFEVMSGRTRALSETFPERNREYWVEKLGEVALSGQPARLDPHRASTGRFYASIAYSPRPGQFAAIFSDVTERVQAAEALRLSEEKFAKAFAVNPAGIVLTRLEDGLIMDVNETWLETYEYTRDEVIGRHATTLQYWPTPEDRKKFIDELLQKGSFQGWEQTVLKKSGAPVVTLASAELLAVGGEKLLLSTWLDISHRKSSEEALRSSEERLRRTLETTERSEALYRGIARNLPEGMVCVVDPDMRCIGIEGALAARWGMDRATIEGRPVLDATEVELRPRVEAHFRYALEGATASYETEIREKVIWSQYAPLRDENGHIVGALMLAFDITDRRRTEERLRQSQKLESVGLLAGGIAHDFNNLLTTVMGNASLLMEDIAPDQAALVRSIISSAERAAHLTRQLLAYSGKGRFVMRDLDVSAAVQESVDLVQFSIPKSVRLKLDLEQRLPVVKMDPGQLQQVLMNLLTNAGEAIGEGQQGRITVATSMADIRDPMLDTLGQEISPGRYAVVEVRDTGSGIAPELLSRIFDPFFTTKFTGRGLGLAAVGGILRSHRGGITVESVPGEGSTFRVLLPVAGKSGDPSLATSTDGDRLTVLVVDDEATVLGVTDSILRRRGYRVVTASDGVEALEVCGAVKGAIDLAIVDLVMPNMSAKDLLPELRARHPGIHILLTSGYSEAEALRLCAAFPGAGFIQKPYTAQQIANAVADLIRSKGSK